MYNQHNIDLLADLFDVSASEIQPTQSLDTFEPWDSMSKLSLIVLFDDELGRRLTGEQVRAFTTLADILQAME